MIGKKYIKFYLRKITDIPCTFPELRIRGDFRDKGSVLAFNLWQMLIISMTEMGKEA